MAIQATFVHGDPLMIDLPIQGTAVNAGDVVGLVGNGGVNCVAHHAIPAGVQGAVSYPSGSAVYDVAKDGTSTFEPGDKVYWVSASKYASSTSAGNTLMGIATRSTLAADATVRIVLSRV